MVFVSEIVKAGFLVTPFACYLCDVTKERKKVPRRRNDKRFILKRREMTTVLYISWFSVNSKRGAFWNANKQTNYNQIKCHFTCFFQNIEMDISFTFLWQWSEFNVTTSSLTKRFSPFIPKKHWKFLYKAVILTRKFWTSYCPSLKLANYWIIIWALFLDNLRGQFSIFINEYSLFMNSCVKPNFLADQFHFFYLLHPSFVPKGT